MEKQQPSFEEYEALSAVRNLVENLLRCLSGGQAGAWWNIMPDIYRAALADQALRKENGTGLSDDSLLRLLAWKEDVPSDDQNASPTAQLWRCVEAFTEDAYASALRVVAYRISGTIKAQEVRAHDAFERALERRERSLEEYRRESKQSRVPRKIPKSDASD